MAIKEPLIKIITNHILSNWKPSLYIDMCYRSSNNKQKYFVNWKIQFHDSYPCLVNTSETEYRSLAVRLDFSQIALSFQNVIMHSIWRSKKLFNKKERERGWKGRRERDRRKEGREEEKNLLYFLNSPIAILDFTMDYLLHENWLTACGTKF